MEQHPQPVHTAETDTAVAPEEIQPVTHATQTAKINHEEIQETQSAEKTGHAEEQLQQAENENKNLKREAFAIVLTLVASAGLLAVANYRQKIKNTEKIAEKNKEIADKRIAELLKEQELKAMNAMMEGQEKERKRIAEDLHDRLGSMLATVKLHFSDVAFSSDCFQSTKCKGQFEKANHLLDEACKEVRRVSHDLASGVLMKFGLVPALNELKQTIESGSKLKVNISSHNLDDRLDNLVEVNVYRVVQELMHNIMKHANASEVNIQLNKLDNVLTVMVEDDGVGFDRNDPEFKPGLGLQSIESRVRKVDGTLTVDSTKGNGTTAIIEIPV
jgi:signal transduction histidine kinase